jgi:DNA-binding beta-propeller fold protein YncE
MECPSIPTTPASGSPATRRPDRNLRYLLQGQGPAGLGYDPKHKVLFASCHDPAMMVAVNAKDGKILDAFPIGPGADGGGFNPKTSEAYSSNGGDGTLTVVKSDGPASFSLLQNVKTMPRAKTMTVGEKTGRIFLIAAEYGPPPAPQPTLPLAAPKKAVAPP